jgi:hypothetical protein
MITTTTTIMTTTITTTITTTRPGGHLDPERRYDDRTDSP